MNEDIRGRVAQEAARLLYYGIYEEYIHAKEAASRNIGVKILPSNYEVAIELDRLADSIEGHERQERLKKLRTLALKVMRLLRDYCPVLTGSVWRGTVRRSSDVDINIYSTDPGVAELLLRRAGYSTGSEDVNVTREGILSRSRHVSLTVDGVGVEVVVRPMKEAERVEHCGTYGDIKKGLTLTELEGLMQKDPLRKFVPRRRSRTTTS